jgi:hypothetical protein
MKEAVSVLLLAVLISSTSIPTLAQKRDVLRKTSLPPFMQTKKQESPGQQRKVDSTHFAKAEAYTDGSGVWVHWLMDTEVDNAGFLLYRIDENGKQLVKDNFTVGADAHYRSGRASGEQYSTFDPLGNAGASYQIEAVSSKKGGKSTLFSVSTQAVSDLSTVSGSSSKFLQSKSSPDDFSAVTTTQVLPSDLQAEVSTFQAIPDPNTQKWVAAQPGVKIGVKNAGIYRVTKAQLQAAGFDVNSDPTLWQLYTDGVEQAITVGGTGDYIEFYGKTYETPETDTRTYFLIVGPSAGKRMASRVSRPSLSTVVSQSYDQTFVKKERISYINTILNGDEENYWGRLIGGSGTTMTFDLTGIPASGTLTFNLSVLGFTQTPHAVNLTLNGNVLPPITGYNGRIEVSTQVQVPVSYLVEGTNSLLMKASSTANDFSLFDTLTLEFPRKYLASQNQLSFHTENYKISKLDGFSSANIRLFDTTYDGSPIIVNNLNIKQNGGTYGINVPAERGRVYYAVEDSAVQQAASIVPNNPSTLSTSNHNASLVIISYKDFDGPIDPTCTIGSANYPGCLPPAQQWAKYRQDQGTTVEVVDVDDIFDEFNYGESSANSIRDFVSYAKNNWQTPPQYIMLIGDGSNDPRNYTGAGYWNLVPAKIVPTIFGETASDDAIVDFNNDGLADLAIGRISARTAQSVLDIFGKVKTFETSAPTLAANGTLFDYDVSGLNDFDFQAMSQRLYSNLPSGTPVTYIGRPDANATANTISAINSGKYLINYSGHGSTGVWGYTSPYIIQNSDVSQMTNLTSPSIFVSLSCLNGYFISPNGSSIGELLLRSNVGGAVAVWASTGETTPDVQETMGTRFYSQLGAGNMTRLGDLVVDAKSVISAGSDVRLSWVLLGDPMLKVH